MSLYRIKSRTSEGDEWIAERRARELRWRAPNVATVRHPRFGKVVVPCGSPTAAVRCAAEYWGCAATEIYDATVFAWEPGDGPAELPAEFAGKNDPRSGGAERGLE